MKIQLSDHFTYGKLFRFCLSPIIMMVFTSIYGVVDGLFVSNFVGKISFAAINLIMPFIMILGGMGFMVGTGGSALVAKTLGEGDNARKPLLLDDGRIYHDLRHRPFYNRHNIHAADFRTAGRDRGYA